MNIGDKVKVIHDTIDGVVVRFLDGNLVEIETSDGFNIPILRHELVVVNVVEEKQMGDKSQQQKRPRINTKTSNQVQAREEKAVVAEKGFYLAFVPYAGDVLSVYLLNNTDLEILFSFCEQQGQNMVGLAAQSLPARQKIKVHEANLATFEKWNPYVLQFILFQHGNGKYREPVSKKLKLTAKKFFKNKQSIPLLNEEGYLFPLDLENTPVFSPKNLQENLQENQSKPTSIPFEKMQVKNTAPAREVDLHIEKLTAEHSNMPKEQILLLQLDIFEKELDEAILAGASQITFIHGVGNGVLRDNIHKKLSKHPHIEYYKDARREKFGYGATLVKF